LARKKRKTVALNLFIMTETATKLQASELRAGNIIQFDDGSADTVKVKYLFENENGWFVYWNKIKGLSSFDQGDSLLVDFVPIPLTPEILEKAGFKDDIIRGEDCLILIITNGIAKCELIFFQQNTSGAVSLFHEREIISGNAYYLHQLQNLYFALTGEELPLNL
jgi:hypothetical protein